MKNKNIFIVILFICLFRPLYSAISTQDTVLSNKLDSTILRQLENSFDPTSNIIKSEERYYDVANHRILFIRRIDALSNDSSLIQDNIRVGLTNLQEGMYETSQGRYEFNPENSRWIKTSTQFRSILPLIKDITLENDFTFNALQQGERAKKVVIETNASQNLITIKLEQQSGLFERDYYLDTNGFIVKCIEKNNRVVTFYSENAFLTQSHSLLDEIVIEDNNSLQYKKETIELELSPTDQIFGFSYRQTEDGLRIYYVSIKTTAYEAGMRPGDLLLEVGDTEVKHMQGEKFHDLLNSKSSHVIKLQQADGKTHTIHVNKHLVSDLKNQKGEIEVLKEL